MYTCAQTPRAHTCLCVCVCVCVYLYITSGLIVHIQLFLRHCKRNKHIREKERKKEKRRNFPVWKYDDKIERFLRLLAAIDIRDESHVVSQFRTMI